MWKIYQYILCPFSRKLRFFMGEKGIACTCVTEYPWKRRPEFLALNPMGQTPTLQQDQDGLVFADSTPICEYFEETVPQPPLLSGTAEEKLEIRRLTNWFDLKFFPDVVMPLLNERMYKRLVSRTPPDTQSLRHAAKEINTHIQYVEHLLDRRRWLAGNSFSLADITAASHLSIADYLTGIDWQKSIGPAVYQWYSAIKSRPSLRPLLAERMEGVHPPAHYDKLDF